ncbi:lyase family protein [Deinococcus radiopugnans]|uniref:argininosuccinate lyase n=1 Tax=Deinococcus radiopugnans ATCC 19172 TaxID=585398 RepID=A0A5C4Y644_9DEIO|nr:lyase family protein [Deinococcus radiopugnans]MBB6015144.1 argininosuccinate lyase [Deinococcus radiopugnans ATCC 19172]TNM70899.1 argininosuccinate lyase [Deinococcus radiopugnans ATCC 19172]
MWHDTYLKVVLQPDYDYASEHLLPHLFDALSAHALMLDGCGVAHAGEAAGLLRELRRQPFPAYDPGVEDVFFTLDRTLAGRNADAAGALRTALSRNDLDMTLYRLSARLRLMRAMERVLRLRRTLLDLAEREIDTVIVAYTHHQPAQPTTLAHYLTAVENVLARDTARMVGAMTHLNLSPMGAVALGGTSFPIDRTRTAELLAFDRPIENTYDAVSASDWQVEIASVITVVSTTLSRVLYDLLFWASRGLLSLEDGLVQGSSVMPQKRNPVALEHARTKFSKAIGVTQSVIISSHNVPFGDINDPGPDMQPPLTSMWHDFRDGLELLIASLTNPTLNREEWLREAQQGESVVTELADVIARNTGCGFRDAHAHVKALLDHLHHQGRAVSTLMAADLAAVGLHLPEAEVQSALNPAEFIARRTTFGGPAPSVMAGEIAAARTRLDTDFTHHASLSTRFADARTHLVGGSI